MLTIKNLFYQVKEAAALCVFTVAILVGCLLGKLKDEEED